MRRFVFICFTLWVIFILYATLSSFKSSNVVFTIPNFDKIVHFVLFFVFSILLIPLLLYKHSFKKTIIIVLATSFFFGASIELIQANFTATRTGSFYDFLADSVGSILSLVAYLYLIKNSKVEKKLFKTR